MVQTPSLTQKPAGTMRFAELQPNLPSSLFPTLMQSPKVQGDSNSTSKSMGMNISRRRTQTDFRTAREAFSEDDEFLDAEIDDHDMLVAGKYIHN